MTTGREETLNVRQTAALLGVHENTVRNWVKSGLLRTARVPGARFHRFYPADVERLRLERGAQVAPAAGPDRLAVGPELIDTRGLQAWASTMDARETLPELVRRLLVSTPGITNIRMRSGEGVGVPGVDGSALSAGTSFLPAGHLIFEMGVGTDIKAKADADYAKRMAGARPGDVFVFVTPRRWRDAAAWERQRQAEKIFADVRVLDVDDVAAWLVQSPATHYWISERLGLRPHDVLTLTTWWERLSGGSNPELPATLFLAGREAEAEEFVQRLIENPVVAVRGTSREDSTAFMYAALVARDASSLLESALVVRSADGWEQMIPRLESGLVIPFFDGMRTAPPRDGIHVAVPAGQADAVRESSIILPRLRRDRVREALEMQQVRPDDAEKLAALGRRSVPALLRYVSRDPRVNRPWWGERPAVSVFAPAVLCDGWTTADHDIALIERLIELPWAEIEPTLTDSVRSPDPVVIRSSNSWMFAALEDAYLILRDGITPRALRRWHELLEEVLVKTSSDADDARSDAPAASGMLRLGLARAAALLGCDDLPMSDGVAGSEHARRAVRAVLSAAEADETGGTWRGLSDVLPLLAEAAPSVFLDAVHDDLDRDRPLLLLMFDDGLGRAHHSGLLWAVERLCWSAEHFVEAVRALARLASIDPGGRLANRPSASLHSVLVGWVSHTTANVEQRLSVVRGLSRSHPEVSWKLTLALLPKAHGVAFPPASPIFRDWKPVEQGVPVREWLQYIDGLVDLALMRTAAELHLWADLLGRLNALPISARERVLEALRNAINVSWPSAARIAVWERLQKEVARNRSHPDASWALDSATVGQLEEFARSIEPLTHAERHAYLFDWRPDIVDADDYDYRSRQVVVAMLRQDVVKNAVSDGRLDRIKRLALRAPVPRFVGYSVAEVTGDSFADDLCEWLSSEEPNLRDAALGWAERWLREGEPGPRLVALLGRPEAQLPERRVTLALAAPAVPAVWKVLARVDDALLDTYWGRLRAEAVSPTVAAVAVREFLARHRPWEAITVLLMAVVAQESAEVLDVPPDLVVSVLDQALLVEPERDAGRTYGYEIGELLNYLDRTGVDVAVLARLEFAFVTVVGDNRRPSALYAALGEDPEMFVELVKVVYRGRNEPRRQLSEYEKALTRTAWRVLQEWDRIPGTRDDGSIASDRLLAWVRKARLALSECDRSDIGDEQIGQVLASSPTGLDGLWPAEAVREVIESVGSNNLETGVFVGVFNRRGVTMRGVYDGGELERTEAVRYWEQARRAASEWPRTSRLLRQIAESLEREAARQDASAQLQADLP